MTNKSRDDLIKNYSDHCNLNCIICAFRDECTKRYLVEEVRADVDDDLQAERDDWESNFTDSSPYNDEDSDVFECECEHQDVEEYEDEEDSYYIDCDDEDDYCEDEDEV